MQLDQKPVNLGSREIIALIFAIIVVLTIFFGSFRIWRSLDAQSREQSAMLRVVNGSHNVLSLVTDAETGQRGFLLTEKNSYLSDYSRSVDEVPAALDELSDAARISPAESRLMQHLRPAVSAKLDELAETIRLRRTQGFYAALSVVNTDRGKSLMDDVRLTSGEMASAANERATLLTNETASSARLIVLLATLGSACLLALLLLATLTVSQGIKRRKELIDALVRTGGEAKVARDWFRTTLESIGDAVITTDRDGRVTLVNPVAQKLTGWKAEEAQGRNLSDILSIHNEATRLPVENPVDRVIREGRAVGLANHTVLTSKQGVVRTIDDSAAPIYDEQGAIGGIVLVFRDVTERKEAEAAAKITEETLRQSEARFRDLAESMPQVVWTTTPDGTLEYINRSWGDSIGFSLDDLKKSSFGHAVQPEDLESFDRAVAEGLRSAAPYTVECRFKNLRDGKLRWHLVRAVPVSNAKGEVIRWYGTSTDIHDQKLVEEECRFRLEELEVVLDAAPAILWITRDPECKHITGNRAANEMLGVSAGVNISSSNQDLSSRFTQWKPDGTQYEVHELPIQRAIAEKQTVKNMEIEFRFPNRRRVHTLGNAAPLFDSANHVRGGVAAFLDITDQKLSQQALVRANEDLRYFAFAASHDLQEPLRMINSYSQLLVREYRGPVNDEAKVCVRFITEGVHRMRELLSDLLSYTQVSGDHDRPVGVVDLNEIVTKASVNLEAAINENQALISADTLPSVLGHPSDFLQLFQNLISNSIKYRREISPDIRITAIQRLGVWRIAVSDNGIGIDPDYQATIFGVFKRLHGRAVPGTGIGLAICQRVVERYGGRIWVESETGQGSTFYFTLAAVEKGASA